MRRLRRQQRGGGGGATRGRHLGESVEVRRRGRRLGGQRVPELVRRQHDQLHSFAGSATNAGSTRSRARALLVWLFTVPTEQPSTWAVSASVRSSK